MGQNGGYNWDVNPRKRKSVTPMELEQRNVVKFLCVKDLKLDEIARELSSTYRWDRMLLRA
jgi:hypothetical protein